MGHESQIEPWSPPERRSGFAGFGTDRLRCQQAMKTAGKKKPQSLGPGVQQPSTWCGRSKQILLIHVGCEARKIPAAGNVFSLDFYLYRTWTGTPGTIAPADGNYVQSAVIPNGAQHSEDFSLSARSQRGESLFGGDPQQDAREI